MGEVADDINNGLMCQVCGTWMGDVFMNDWELFKNPPGYPRTCGSCKKDEKTRKWKERKKKNVGIK